MKTTKRNGRNSSCSHYTPAALARKCCTSLGCIIEARSRILRQLPTDQDMIDCSVALVQYLKQNPEHFLSISCLITCVLNSRRLLTVQELESVFYLFGKVALPDQDVVQSHDIFSSLVEKTDSPFEISHCGHIDFKNAHMYAFLDEFEIDGIDLSHAVIAGACRAALAEEKSDNSVVCKGFLAYAQQHCQLHWDLAVARQQSLHRNSSTCDEKLAQQMLEINLDASDEEWIVLENGETEV